MLLKPFRFIIRRETIRIHETVVYFIEDFSFAGVIDGEPMDVDTVDILFIRFVFICPSHIVDCLRCGNMHVHIALCQPFGKFPA